MNRIELFVGRLWERHPLAMTILSLSMIVAGFFLVGGIELRDIEAGLLPC